MVLLPISVIVVVREHLTLRRRIVTGLPALLVTGMVAEDGNVDGWEQAFFHAINDLPSWLEPPMDAAQLLRALG